MFGILTPYRESTLQEEILIFLQWPAMAFTLLSAWMVASVSKTKRRWGFWCFVISNILWVLWGWQTQAYALILMQVGLLFLNIRGIYKNPPSKENS